MGKNPLRRLAMDNVRIRTKLWVLVGVLAMPIVALMAWQFVSLQESVEGADREAHGITFETAALNLVAHLQEHRDQEMRYLRGNAATKAALDQASAAVDKDFADLAQLSARWRSDLGIDAELAALRSEWERFKAEPRSTAAASFDGHTALITGRAIPMLMAAATGSGLLTDSDLATRNVVDALMASVNMSEQIAQGRAIGYVTMVEKAGQEPSVVDRNRMNDYLTRAAVYADELRFHIDVAIREEPALAEELQPLIDRQGQSQTNFSSFVSANFVVANVLEATRAESFYLLGTSAVTSANQLVTAAAANLDVEFADRRSAAMRQMQVVAGVAFFGIAAALVLAIAIARSITRPVSHLAEVADRISLGELDVEIDVHGSNEVGQLAESLRRMQTSLRSAIERLRQRRAA